MQEEEDVNGRLLSKESRFTLILYSWRLLFIIPVMDTQNQSEIEKSK